MRELKEQIISIAESPCSVLIYGETGTDKELIAKTIHYNSDRADIPFVDVNAAAIPENLVESELFGIEEGIATGINKRIGIFEQAHNGTLFIDEIGEMSAQSQIKILRALEERKIRRVGSRRNIDISIRLLTASNKNLKQESEKGAFRSDLYYRLSVFELVLPPLRERRDDIPLLTTHFTQKYAVQMGIVAELRRLAIQKWVRYDLEELSRELSAKIRGWYYYYGKFRPSEMQRVFRLLNIRIAKWARNKYKLHTYAQSYGWLKRTIRFHPNAFVHWQYGFTG